MYLISIKSFIKCEESNPTFQREKMKNPRTSCLICVNDKHGTKTEKVCLYISFTAGDLVTIASTLSTYFDIQEPTTPQTENDFDLPRLSVIMEDSHFETKIFTPGYLL